MEASLLNRFPLPTTTGPIEKVANINIEHPVHFSRQQSRVERIQRLVLAAPGPEPIGKTEKVRFVDSAHHLERRALDNLVSQLRHSKQACAARRPSGYIPYAPASLGTLLASAF